MFDLKRRYDFRQKSLNRKYCNANGVKSKSSDEEQGIKKAPKPSQFQLDHQWYDITSPIINSTTAVLAETPTAAHTGFISHLAELV